MVEIAWTEPALADLDAIADYIAIENHQAAAELVRRVFVHVGYLEQHPRLGRIPPEFGKSSRYRELIEPPCRIFYRRDVSRLPILHVMRSEQRLRKRHLRRSPVGI